MCIWNNLTVKNCVSLALKIYVFFPSLKPSCSSTFRFIQSVLTLQLTYDTVFQTIEQKPISINVFKNTRLFPVLSVNETSESL